MITTHFSSRPRGVLIFLCTVSVLLTVLTILEPDWLESVGVNADASSGALERLLCAVFAGLAAVAGVMATRNQAAYRPAPEPEL